MSRRPWVSGAVLAVVVTAFLAATSDVGAAPAVAAICPPFSMSGLKYQSEVVGTGFTCKSAKVWMVKLSKDRVHGTTPVTLHNGPRGYHCKATTVSKGLAVGGLCYKGTPAFPGSGFTWDGS